MLGLRKLIVYPGVFGVTVHSCTFFLVVDEVKFATAVLYWWSRCDHAVGRLHTVAEATAVEVRVGLESTRGVGKYAWGW